MRVIAFLIILLLFGAFFIISNENLALKDTDKRMKFARHYYAWFLGILGNFKDITGAVIRTNWLPSSGNNTR